MMGYIEAEPAISDPFHLNWGLAWRAKKSFLKLFAKVLQIGKTVEAYQETIHYIVEQLQEPVASPNDALRKFRLREQIYIGHYARLAAEGHLDESQVRPKRTVSQVWRELTNSARGKETRIARWLPWRRVLAYPLVRLLRNLFALRDKMLAAEATGMAAVRTWDLAQATKWVQADYLKTADDYFWLNMEEIERALIAEDEAGIYLKPTIRARQETYRSYAEIKMPVVIKDSEIPNLYQGNRDSQRVLSGTLLGLPVSPGQVQGVVKILEETDSLDQIPAGSILVAPSTDPALLAFFPLAAGLIVEVGGMLSHGSIIAREYGIPAVSSITDARERLKSGDRVLLDGSTGVVQVLESAP